MGHLAGTIVAKLRELFMVLGEYSTTPVTLTTDGEQAPLQLDSSGRLKIAGTVTATVDTSALAQDATLTGGTTKVQPIDGSGNVQPAGDTVARAAFVKLTDGTNAAAVKAASTAALATDPSAVAQLSPNDPLEKTVGGHDVAGLPTNVVVEGGVGSDTAPAAVTTGRPVRGWRGRVGQAFSTLVDVAGTVIFPTAAAAADDQALPTTTWLKSVLFANDGSGSGTPLQGLRAGVVGLQTAFRGFLNVIPMARYNLGAQAPGDGNMLPLQIDANGYLRVAEQQIDQFVDNTVGVAKVEQRFTKAYITTATTTQVFSGTGFLAAIIFNKGVATGTVKLIDGTSGSTTNIGLPTYGAALSGDFPVIIYNLNITAGLRIITDQAMDITVLYRAP